MCGNKVEYGNHFMALDTLGRDPTFGTRKTTFMNSFYGAAHETAFKKRSTLKGANLLPRCSQREQICSM